MNEFELIKHAVEIIKTWHNLGSVPGPGTDGLWKIYYEKSPEMKPLREYLEGKEKKEEKTIFILAGNPQQLKNYVESRGIKEFFIVHNSTSFMGHERGNCKLIKIGTFMDRDDIDLKAIDDAATVRDFEIIEDNL